MSMLNYLDTHSLYEIYIDRRSGTVGGRGDYWGDPQVHVLNFQTTRLPTKVTKMLKPFGSERHGDVVKWFYLPGTSIEMILSIFKINGYNIIETREGAPDRINGRRSPVYIVGKKR